MSSEERGLSRWARRKAQARASRGAAAPAPEAEPEATLPAETGTAGIDTAGGPETEPAVAPEDLPDVDSLTAESDFTAFMKEGVPQHLRRLALRKLWSSNPVLANLDGLIEYGEDYNNVAAVAEGIQSAWQVGRGYAKADPAAPDGTAADPDAVAADPDGAVDESPAEEVAATATGDTDTDAGPEAPSAPDRDAEDGRA